MTATTTKQKLTYASNSEYEVMLENAESINRSIYKQLKKANQELARTKKRLEIKSFLAHQYEFDSHMNEYIADQRLEGWEREEKLVTTWKYVALIFLGGFIYLVLTNI